ncbi:MAG: hypothetical protein KDD52_09365 [Bdellovibrionales bacterium]|nr:hypothetical protein [Bdellovibrionales bacterium]
MMKKREKINQYRSFGVLLSLFLFAISLGACGKGDVIRAVRNGVSYEFDVQSMLCSPSNASTGSAYISQLNCDINYNVPGNQAGTIEVTINSVAEVLQQGLNQDIFLSQGSVWAVVKEGFNPESTSSGVINFSALTNYINGEVCFRLDMTTLSYSDLYTEVCGPVVTYGSYYN